MNFRLGIPFVSAFLGSAYALAGRVQEGIPLLQQAVDATTSMKLVSNRSWLLMQLGEAHLIAGRADEASGLIDQALDLAVRHEERGWEAWGLHLRGEVHARSVRPALERALDAYNEAAARAEALKMKPLLAHCDLSRGKVYGHAGDKNEANRFLKTALTSMREMDMRFWLDTAERDRELLSA